MTHARKKVIVRRFGTGILRGYLPVSGFVRHLDGDYAIDLLDLEGKQQLIPLEQVLRISFVREFNLNDDVHPEKLPRRTFLARPRTEGLWVRMAFRDGEPMEGLAPLDLSLADGLAEDQGLQFTPPDVRGNTQRVYVPRTALLALQVVAVVTTPSRRRQPGHIGAPGDDAGQLALALADTGDGR